MSKPIIQVDHLSKRYRLGTFGYGSLQRDVASLWARMRGKPDPNAVIGSDTRTANQEFWALKDVSFEVQQGEVLGVIGSNGAGKSTLLKILSRITAPTEGRAELRGRVASMLEVGTGFHPELTGRENVFLNGAILGMTKAEIVSKFDEIVDFSGIEQFIDTPVKRYSSGMYVRLAFAVAAHLEPEILLVDEVLAVGDAAFQKKCLGKMGDVAREGRTILFVSHNMAAVRNLCHRVIWVDGGCIRDFGETEAVVYRYLDHFARAERLEDIPDTVAMLPDDPVFKMIRVDVLQDEKPTLHIENGKPVHLRMTYQVKRRVSGLRIYMELLDRDKHVIFRSNHDDLAEAIITTEQGQYVSEMILPANWLAPLPYFLRLGALVNSTLENYRVCTPGGLTIPFDVKASNTINSIRTGIVIQAMLQPAFEWVTLPLPEGLDLQEIAHSRTIETAGKEK
jgi:lipopolysaccharide transport system ATP-binding protein